MSKRHLCLLLSLSALYAGLNLFKPLHIDDPAYFYLARQFAANPLDPYGFFVQWWDNPQPANEVLAPPVLSATWGPAIALFGERPWLWKLFLWPWSLLLVWALDALIRRFAGALEVPLLILAVFSPALLPSLNLMLDVPALALTLAAIHLFLQACDRDSLPLAALAGLVTGLAMQTKYTGFVALGVMLLAGGLARRWRLWPAAVLVAAHVFVAWEFLMAMLYGESHFLIAVRRAMSPGGSKLEAKLSLLVGLFANLGGLLPAVLLLGLATLGAGKRALWLTAVLIVAAYLIALCWGPIEGAYGPFQVVQIVCVGFSLAGLAILALVVQQFLITEETRQETLFLLGWLVLEVIGYFFLSPFPAVRRVLSIAVVVLLLVGRAVVGGGWWVVDGGRGSASCLPPSTTHYPPPTTVWGVVAFGVVLALGFWALDFREAQAEEEAVERALAWIETQGDGGTVWYTGHWGFQFDAEHRGLRPIYPDCPTGDSYVRLPPRSRLHAGDWVVCRWRPTPSSRAPSFQADSQRSHLQGLDFDNLPLQPEACLVVSDPLPLRTVWCFYLGFVPIEHDDGERLLVWVYRVTSDFTAPCPSG